jgi:hypothetical protein
MFFRVLDIETVPDLSTWTPSEIKWELVPGAPGLSTQHLLRPVASWPPPQANRVVAVSHLLMEATLSKEEGRRYVFRDFYTKAAWGADDEKLLIAAFGESQTKQSATIVSWAGRSFDLPVLAMRALKHGLDWGWYYQNKSVRYRYSDEGHCDLMDVLSDYGASRSLKLGDAARLVGLPGKTDMDGSKVADVVAQGPNEADYAKVARYCGHDVLQTALVFLRSRMLFGYLDQAGLKHSAETFKDVAKNLSLEVDWNSYLML